VEKVAIMVDSVAHMPQELADKYNVKMVPMGIVIDGKAYPETEVDLPQYYQKILETTETEKLPTSSSVTVGSFLEKFRELSQEAEAILYIGTARFPH
jgi:fatty acid-binding protein DegV